QSFKAFRTNPLGRRIIETIVNFVLGNGISVNASHPEGLEEIKSWWNDPYNRWPLRIQGRARDLFVYGEWLHRPLPDKTGFIRIGDVQPDNLCGVVSDQFDA